MRKCSTSEDIKNANENYTEIPNPAPVSMAVTKTITTGEGGILKETCVHCCWNVILFGHHGNQC